MSITDRIKENLYKLEYFIDRHDEINLKNISIERLFHMKVDDFAKMGCTLQAAHDIFEYVKEGIQSLNEDVISSFAKDEPNKLKLINLLQSNVGAPLITIKEEYFFKHFPRNWISVDIFQQSFSRLFADYQSNWLNNQSKLLMAYRSTPTDYLNHQEFIEKYGEPPWDFVNSVLETANIDFRIEQLPVYEGRPYEPILTDRTRGTQVKFADLSSGERVLMSFALCLYYAQDRRQMVNYPKILLFDEIDAPLHPSMTQSLLRII